MNSTFQEQAPSVVLLKRAAETLFLSAPCSLIEV